MSFGIPVPYQSCAVRIALIYRCVTSGMELLAVEDLVRAQSSHYVMCTVGLMLVVYRQ